jgi:ADP-dependent NAD(P)H-hydrate dehydratase
MPDNTSATAIPQLAARDRHAHKGNFGRALIVGGSTGMTGAVALTGMATLRGGAGLVTLAVPAVCLDVIASFDPSYMTVPLPHGEDGRLTAHAEPVVREHVLNVDCLACGPGLGRSPAITELVGQLYSTTPQTMVIDADGLNALAARQDGLAGAAGPRILTPHVGEFRRLIRASKATPGECAQQARELANKYGFVIALKGHRTLVTDGQRVYVNTTGNPGMATGGSGDVLTGIITALVCQGLLPFDAAQLGVYLHGLAGDLAADVVGEVSLIASDLLAYLPNAIRRHQESARK